MLKRLRFTYAHEVGHIVLHSEEIEGIELESEDDWIKFRTSFSEDDLSRFEFQAYEFAGRLLVPKNKLMEELEKNRKKIKLYINNSNPYNQEELIEAISRVICDVFKVSDGVISRRIEREDIWEEMGF